MGCGGSLPSGGTKTFFEICPRSKLGYCNRLLTDDGKGSIPFGGTNIFILICCLSSFSVHLLQINLTVGKNIKWTKNEDDVLLQYYVDQGPDFCFKFLNRSIRGIKHRAQILHLYMNNKTKGEKNRKYTKEVLEPVVKNSINYADVLRNLGVKAQAANYTNIKKRILEYGLDVSHFKSSSELTSMRNKTRYNFFVKKPTEKYLIENSTIYNQNLKKLLYYQNLKQPIC